MHLHEQIAAVFAKTGWSVAEFLGKSGLDMDRSQLQRKLTGQAPMRTREAQALVDTLRKNGVEITIAWPADADDVNIERANEPHA